MRARETKRVKRKSSLGREHFTIRARRVKGSIVKELAPAPLPVYINDCRGAVQREGKERNDGKEYRGSAVFRVENILLETRR